MYLSHLVGNMESEEWLHFRRYPQNPTNVISLVKKMIEGPKLSLNEITRESKGWNLVSRVIPNEETILIFLRRSLYDSKWKNLLWYYDVSK